MLADSLCTDRHRFHPVRLDEPATVRLRELSRLEDENGQKLSRAADRLREQVHRDFPELIQFCPAADELWLWTLLEQAPLPTRGARLPETKIARTLLQHRIFRIRATEVRAPLKTQLLILARKC